MKYISAIIIAIFLSGCGEVQDNCETQTNYFCFFNQVYKVQKFCDDSSISELLANETCTIQVEYKELEDFKEGS